MKIVISAGSIVVALIIITVLGTILLYVDSQGNGTTVVFGNATTISKTGVITTNQSVISTNVNPSTDSGAQMSVTLKNKDYNILPPLQTIFLSYITFGEETVGQNAYYMDLALTCARSDTADVIANICIDYYNVSKILPSQYSVITKASVPLGGQCYDIGPGESHTWNMNNIDIHGFRGKYTIAGGCVATYESRGQPLLARDGTQPLTMNAVSDEVNISITATITPG